MKSDTDGDTDFVRRFLLYKKMHMQQTMHIIHNAATPPPTPPPMAALAFEELEGSTASVHAQMLLVLEYQPCTHACMFAHMNRTTTTTTKNLHRYALKFSPTMV